MKLAEEWTSMAPNVRNPKTKQQHRDTFDAPTTFNDKLLDPASPDSSAASGNKYPPDSDLLFNSIHRKANA